MFKKYYIKTVAKEKMYATTVKNLKYNHLMKKAISTFL